MTHVLAIGSWWFDGELANHFGDVMMMMMVMMVMMMMMVT